MSLQSHTNIIIRLLFVSVDFGLLLVPNLEFFINVFLHFNYRPIRSFVELPWFVSNGEHRSHDGSVTIEALVQSLSGPLCSPENRVLACISSLVDLIAKLFC
jgi:hypothetical protein